jgi:hypothetical protein
MCWEFWSVEECRRSRIGREQIAREVVLRYKLERLEEQVDIFLETEGTC